MLVLSFLFFLVDADIKLLDPPDLCSKTSFEMSQARFSEPKIPYLIGSVHYDKKNKFGCSPFSPLSKSIFHISSSPIILLYRGNCSFITKVRNAQNVGAAAVIFVDNKEEDISSVLVIDDGTAENITIPSVLVSKNDGYFFRGFLYSQQEYEELKVNITFDLLKRPNYAEFEFWMSYDQRILGQEGLITKGLPEFAVFAQNFEGEITFTPHFLLSEVPNNNWYYDPNQRFSSPQPNCLSGGRYCTRYYNNINSQYYQPFYCPGAMDTIHINGRGIMMEYLRELCIFKIAKNSNQPNLWWKYIIEVNETCYWGLWFSKDCSNTAMEKIGVDINEVEKCMFKSFRGENMLVDDNVMLKIEKESANGMQIEPGKEIMQLNGDTFAFKDAVGALAAICGKFDKLPAVCQDYFMETYEEIIKPRPT
jgi:hypothetical protein